MKNDKLTQLLKTHHTDAFRWASQCCNYQHEDAEEVLQMSYLKIASGKARFNERSTFKTWLFAVIRNTARDYLDKQVRFEQLDPLSQTPAEAIPEDRTNYRALLARLPERQQRTLAGLLPRNDPATSSRNDQSPRRHRTYPLQPRKG